MRLREPDKLTPEEKFITQQVEKRQIIAMDINATEAQKHFKDLPWAMVLITPTFLFFRD